MEDDIASENTTSSEGSDGGHPPQVSHYPILQGKEKLAYEQSLNDT